MPISLRSIECPDDDEPELEELTPEIVRSIVSCLSDFSIGFNVSSAPGVEPGKILNLSGLASLSTSSSLLSSESMAESTVCL